MAKFESIPRKRRLPSFRGRYMVDTVRGVIRVRAWPKKRGPAKSEAQRYWIDWFKQANLLAKYADAMSLARAIEITKNTGMYPRDVLLAAMRGRLYTWVDETGWRWYPMAARGDISESLDVLSQTVGSLLVRAETYWKDVAPGVLGNVLTHRGPLTPPEWIAPAGGGGVTQENLFGTPITPDNTVSIYNFDVSAYYSVTFAFRALGFAGNSRPMFRFSIDGGATFKAGASDYWGMEVTHGSSRMRDYKAVLLTNAQTTTNYQAMIKFDTLRAGRGTWNGMASRTTSLATARSGLFSFDSPITDIQLWSELGTNFNAGTIWAIGNK